MFSLIIRNFHDTGFSKAVQKSHSSRKAECYFYWARKCLINANCFSSTFRHTCPKCEFFDYLEFYFLFFVFFLQMLSEKFQTWIFIFSFNKYFPKTDQSKFWRITHKQILDKLLPSRFEVIVNVCSSIFSMMKKLQIFI